MFIDSRLLDCIDYQSTFTIAFNTQITAADNGQEVRKQLYNDPLRIFNVTYNQAGGTQDNIKAAYLVARGKLHSFRFKDWSDYKARITLNVKDAGEFRTTLFKNYHFAGYQYKRLIKLPVYGSMRVLDANGKLLIEGIDWDVVYDSGAFSIHNSQAQTYTVHFEFDVLVRFDDDNLTFTPTLRTDDADIFGEIQGVNLREIRFDNR